VIAIFAQPSFADECSTADLNESSDSPFRNIPIYDQDGTGTCYAHAAAQLADYWSLKKNPKRPKSERINPIYAAWQTKFLYQINSDTGGGLPEDVIRSLKYSGYCKNDDVQERLKKAKKEGGNLTDAELVHYYEILCNTDKLAYRDLRGVNRAIENDDWVAKVKCTPLHQRLTTGLSLSLNFIEYTSNLVLGNHFKGCKLNKSTSTMPNPKTFDYENFGDKKKRFDLALENGKPLSINMCSSLFENPSKRFLNNKNRVINKDQCSPHSVLVTARKKIGNSCQYMVRNSWGSMWTGKKGTKCACYTKDGTYESDCTNFGKAKAVVGCWYSEKDLISNTFGTIEL